AFSFCFQAEDGIRDFHVTGVQTCALPISTLTLIQRPHPRAKPPPAMPAHPHGSNRRSSIPTLSPQDLCLPSWHASQKTEHWPYRSEERRVGKGGRALRWRGRDKNEVREEY